MAAIEEGFKTIEREKSNLPKTLKEASKNHSGTVLLTKYQGGLKQQIFTLRKGYVSQRVYDVYSCTESGDRFRKFSKVESIKYNAFRDMLDLKELREVADALIHIDF